MEQCEIPECSKPKWYDDRTKRWSPCCGRWHHSLYRETLLSRSADFLPDPNKCYFSTCVRAPAEGCDFCCRSHALEGQRELAQRMWASPLKCNLEDCKEPKGISSTGQPFDYCCLDHAKQDASKLCCAVSDEELVAALNAKARNPETFHPPFPIKYVECLEDPAELLPPSSTGAVRTCYVISKVKHTKKRKGTSGSWKSGGRGEYMTWKPKNNGTEMYARGCVHEGGVFGAWEISSESKRRKLKSSVRNAEQPGKQQHCEAVLAVQPQARESPAAVLAVQPQAREAREGVNSGLSEVTTSPRLRGLNSRCSMKNKEVMKIFHCLYQRISHPCHLKF